MICTITGKKIDAADGIPWPKSFDPDIACFIRLVWKLE